MDVEEVTLVNPNLSPNQQEEAAAAEVELPSLKCSPNQQALEVDVAVAADISDTN